MTITEWCEKVIEGPSGMNAYEEREFVSWFKSDRVAAAEWVIRCLANPKCEGSAEVLEAIMEHRKELIENEGEVKEGEGTE
jgi:hypothetical protein